MRRLNQNKTIIRYLPYIDINKGIRMQIGYSTRIHPSDIQASTLAQWIGFDWKDLEFKSRRESVLYVWKKFVPNKSMAVV